MNTTIDINRTLGGLVTEKIDRARVFEWFGLDYCCGGGKTLSQACAEKNLDPAKVTAELSRSDMDSTKNSNNGIEGLTISQLIDDIVSNHHAFLRMELPRLAQLTNKIAGVHGGNHPNLLKVRDIYAALRTELEMHMKEEEESLFPTLRLLNSGGFTMLKNDATATIRKMEEEHADVGEKLAEIAALTEGYKLPADACETYRVTLHGLMTLEQDIHLHVHKENNILFRNIDGSMGAKQNNLHD